MGAPGLPRLWWELAGHVVRSWVKVDMWKYLGAWGIGHCRIQCPGMAQGLLGSGGLILQVVRLRHGRFSMRLNRASGVDPNTARSSDSAAWSGAFSQMLGSSLRVALTRFFAKIQIFQGTIPRPPPPGSLPWPPLGLFMSTEQMLLPWLLLCFLLNAASPVGSQYQLLFYSGVEGQPFYTRSPTECLQQGFVIEKAIEGLRREGICMESHIQKKLTLTSNIHTQGPASHLPQVIRL